MAIQGIEKLTENIEHTLSKDGQACNPLPCHPDNPCSPCNPSSCYPHGGCYPKNHSITKEDPKPSNPS